MKTVLAIFIALLFPVGFASEATPDPNSIGIEEGSRIVLTRGDYVPRPLDDRTPLIIGSQGNVDEAMRFVNDPVRG